MSESIRFGAFELRPAQRQLLAGGRPLALGARAFDVLVVLAERAGAVVAVGEVLDRVWPEVVVEENNVQVQVSALRKVLGARAIENIPGRGYRLALEREAPGAAAGARAQAREAAAVPPAATNVPPALAPLLGRDEELAALDALVARHRLVSLVGPGGIGKTRLAQALALHRAAAHAQGAWLVALAPLAAAERIGPAVAAALRVELRGDGESAADQLARSVATHDALVVLDNCEHLIDGVAALARSLLAASPALRIVATTQQPLGIAGEQVLRLGSLSLPEPSSPLDEALGHGALALLVQRAQAADRRFALTPATLEPAIALVRQLDGNPLAIGMAAARLPALGLAAVRERLADNLNWLRSAERDAPARQASLRAALEWSHGLLDDPARAVLRRLAVFTASFDLERARVVAALDDLDADAALDALAELVNRSLVMLDALEPPRYRLLETTRRFAAERLRDAGEAQPAQQRHAQALAERAEAAVERWWRLGDGEWMAEVEPDADDLAAAADHALAVRDAALAAPLLEALMRLDEQRGVDATRRARMRSALALLADPQAATRARLENDERATRARLENDERATRARLENDERATRARLENDERATRARLAQAVAPHPPIALTEIGRVAAAEQAVAAWREVGDDQRLYVAQTTLAYELGLAGRHAEALAALDAARALEAPHWPPRLRQQLASRAGCVAGFAGDVTNYRREAERALEWAEAAGDLRGALRHRLCLVDAALMAGDDERAVALGHAAVASIERIDSPSLLVNALLNLCAAQLRCGDDEGARGSAARALPLAWPQEQAGFLVDHVALLAARRGQPAAAAQLAAWSDAWYAAHGHQHEANEVRALQECRTIVRQALGAAEVAQAAAQGAALDDAAALRLARRAIDAG